MLLKFQSIVLAALAVIAPLASLPVRAAAAAAPAASRVVLPDAVVPQHYDVEVTPDAEHLSFRGRVRIDVQVLRATDSIVLNAADLSFERVTLAGREEAPKITLDAQVQTATFGFSAPITPPAFSLPFAAPASPLPKNENDFGSQRLFNGKLESEHTGRDYPVNEGTPVKAIADGSVVLAEPQFVTGNSVYIDHGDGLISASFHLSAIAVHTGDTVKRGQVIGKVGGTGRASGVHLHLGIRWLTARVDPQPLLEKPLQLHDVGDSPIEVERKDKKVKQEPKESNATIRRDEEG